MMLPCSSEGHPSLCAPTWSRCQTSLHPLSSQPARALHSVLFGLESGVPQPLSVRTAMGKGSMVKAPSLFRGWVRITCEHVFGVLSMVPGTC